MLLSVSLTVILLAIANLNLASAFRPRTEVMRSVLLAPSLRQSQLQMSSLADRLGGIVEFISGQTTITEENVEVTLKEIKTTLLDADVNLQVCNSLITKVKERAIGMKVEKDRKPGEQFISLLAAGVVLLTTGFTKKFFLHAY